MDFGYHPELQTPTSNFKYCHWKKYFLPSAGFEPGTFQLQSSLSYTAKLQIFSKNLFFIKYVLFLE